MGEGGKAQFFFALAPLPNWRAVKTRKTHRNLVSTRKACSVLFVLLPIHTDLFAKAMDTEKQPDSPGMVGTGDKCISVFGRIPDVMLLHEVQDNIKPIQHFVFHPEERALLGSGYLNGRVALPLTSGHGGVRWAWLLQVTLVSLSYSAWSDAQDRGPIPGFRLTQWSYLPATLFGDQWTAVCKCRILATSSGGVIAKPCITLLFRNLNKSIL